MIAQISEVINLVSGKIKAGISKCNVDDERFHQLIDLYNQQDEYEEGCERYIGNINDSHDVGYLYDCYKGGEDSCYYKEPRVAELGLMVVNRNSDYFMLCEEDATFLAESEIAIMIGENAYKLAQFLFRHPYEHKELWEDYVVTLLN